MKLDLTPKGKCLFDYINDKANGKDVYIEEYENMSKQLLIAHREACDELLDDYLKKHKKSKLVNVKLLINIHQFGLNIGDTIKVYDAPAYDNVLSLLLDRKPLKYLKYWLPIINGEYDGLALYKWQFEIVR